jgi:hypothetical protein
MPYTGRRPDVSRAEKPVRRSHDFLSDPKQIHPFA